MTVAVLQEDLQFIAQILQEQLRAEIPSGDFFQVKCAVKNDQMLILVQHPDAVTPDTEIIFAVLEEALYSLPTHREQQVELFLRVAGVKLPYTKRSLIWSNPHPQEAGEESTNEQVELIEILQEKQEMESSPAISTANSNPNQQLLLSNTPDPKPTQLQFPPMIDIPVDEQQEEQFDPMAGAPDFSSYTQIKQRRQVQTIVLGTFAIAIAGFGGGAYLLTRPCVISECKEIQTAQNLQNSFRQLIRSVKSEQELTNIQQQLLTASVQLEVIPSWSPRHQQAETLAANLSTRSEMIAQVVKAFETGSSAMQKNQTPAKSIEELKTRQQQWRQAIAPLEAINANNELYGLVQPKLAVYRTKLQALNQQLLVEEKWLKQLATAKDTAYATIQRETTAKSLLELQKVQANWQMAVNILSSIPQSSSIFPEAQKLLVEYKPKLATARDRATKQLLTAKSYQQAVNTAKIAKQNEKQNQWQMAVSHWKQALTIVKQINQESLYYNQAQSLIEPYANSLSQAEEKLEAANFFQQIRADLEKTCGGEIRVCSFTVTEREILVRITPEYEQALNISLNQKDQNNVATVTTHLQSLQQALEVIGDNAKLAVIVFDAQGNQIHSHMPGGG
ncbi:hypothetical protein [Chlorogloeopsis sp. ULAP02]|uniref:hypothetical protein n=1 Tax=Chlorogloeopsis sp. ULAP02 TaxID=3107926 RepID=UPI0031358614